MHIENELTEKTYDTFNNCQPSNSIYSRQLQKTGTKGSNFTSKMNEYGWYQEP